MIISVDFDSTLDQLEVKTFIKYLIKIGIKVIVCTSRSETYKMEPFCNWNDDFVFNNRFIKNKKKRYYIYKWKR